MMMSTAPVAATCAEAARQLNVVDLPTDILVNIFSHFQHQHIDRYGTITGGVPLVDVQRLRRDTQNARLVCHVFNRYASPHLCSVLKLSLEPDSLDMIDSLLTNSPFVLEGVRVVEISMLYRPRELAQSLNRFQERRLSDLDEDNRRCDYHAESWYLGGHDPEDETVCALPKRAYDEASANYYLIRAAWNQELECTDTETTGEDLEKMAEYRRILRQGHVEYQKKHEEQMRLLTDGSFVKAVTALVSQTRRPCSLEFVDDQWQLTRKSYEDPTRLLSNTNELSKFMSTPHHWRTIEDGIKSSDFTPLTLLAALPIAIQRQGTILQGVRVNWFPHHAGHFEVCGPSHEPLWDDLAASSKQLRSFGFKQRGDHKGMRYEHLQGEDKACIDRYFDAMLSSPCLEYLSLSFYSYSLHDGKSGAAFGSTPRAMDMGSVLFKTPFPQIREAKISNISTGQTDLEDFCRGLGEGLRQLYIYDIEIVSGTWLRTLEILRERFSARCLEGRCRIMLTDLFGGEYGSRRLEDDRWWMMDFKLPEKPPLLVQSEKYVNGDSEVTENPLRPAGIAGS